MLRRIITTTKMDDLASMGFTAFGKSKPTPPIHSSPNPTTLPPRPQFQQNQNQNQGRGRGRGRGHNHRGNFRGGPQRSFHTNQRGGSHGRHHHPYPPRTDRETPTEQYHSPSFGEGLYKPSMNENPWSSLLQTQGTTSTTNNTNTWQLDQEERAEDGGGWNKDEINLDD
ncbi:hypothetical protein TWF481_008689 [Arthrobotrys musiformis]|uniref:Uncharacterized protein n=1 Tax=Arthrobotrys musiformis TaxID=47236 RepID=A0AAV9W8V1_9PEZI